jgi:hypothetical protein
VTLVDPKRGQNAGIALARIKLSFEDVRTKIMRMENDAFTPEQLTNLELYLPTKEEQSVLKSYKGDISVLGKAEQYMLVMMQLPTASKRLQCMMYRQQFKARVMELKLSVSIIEGACDDVRMSSKFKKVLKTILKVGNQMNDGADSKAFSIDSLLKLHATKGFDNKTSILHYIIRVISKNDQTSLSFTEELSHVADASKYTFGMLTAERNNLKNGLDACARSVAEFQQADNSARFVEGDGEASAAQPMSPGQASVVNGMSVFVSNVSVCKFNYVAERLCLRCLRHPR